MQGVIAGIKRMEIHDGDGLRTTVFFKGCPLQCRWCHNPESIAFERQLALFTEKCLRCGSCAAVCPAGAIRLHSGGAEIDRFRCTRCFRCAASCPTEAILLYGQKWDVDALFEKVMQDEAFFKAGQGGVTFSGGECLAQPEFACALAKRFAQGGISVNIDTCGYVNRGALEAIIPYTDTFLYDIKAMDPEVHKRCTGRDNALILKNLRYLVEAGCRIEIRYPLVKGYNDGECEKIGEFLGRLGGITRIKTLAYHGFAASRYRALGMENTLPDTEVRFADVEKAVAILQSYGLHAVNGLGESVDNIGISD